MIVELYLPDRGMIRARPSQIVIRDMSGTVVGIARHETADTLRITHAGDYDFPQELRLLGIMEPVATKILKLADHGLSGARIITPDRSIKKG